MPLIMVPWDQVSMDMLNSMSTMAVKSGILQACKALHHLHYVPVEKEARDSGRTGEISLEVDIVEMITHERHELTMKSRQEGIERMEAGQQERLRAREAQLEDEKRPERSRRGSCRRRVNRTRSVVRR